MNAIEKKRSLIFRGLLRCVCEKGFQDLDEMGLPMEFWKQEEQKLLGFVRQATRGRASPGSMVLLSRQFQIEFSDVPSAAIEHWVKELRKVFLYEQITLSCGEILEALGNDKAEEPDVEKARSLMMAGSYKIGQMVENEKAQDVIMTERISKMLGEMADSPAIDTPFPYFNETVGGIRRGELFVFCAMSGVGKTMLLIMMALHAVKRGKKVLFINTEMSNDDLLLRVINFMGVDTTAWRGSPPSKKDQDYVKNMISSFNNRHLFKAKEYNHSRKLEDLEYDILAAEPDLICVDSAYELQKRKFENREDHLRKGEIFTDLKDFAKRHRVPIMATSQMNQAKSDSDDEPKRLLFNQSRVAYSQGIARVSDYTFYLQNVPDDNVKIRVIPAKFRSSKRCSWFEIDTHLKTYYFHSPVIEPKSNGAVPEDKPV